MSKHHPAAWRGSDVVTRSHRLWSAVDTRDTIFSCSSRRGFWNGWLLTRVNDRIGVDFKTEFYVSRQVFDIYDIVSATFSEQNGSLEQSGNYLITLMVHRRYRA
jgi:hypothetical protein